MTLDEETAWNLDCLNLAGEFSAACRRMQTRNPSQTMSAIDVIITDLATELWDQGFSQTEIRQALETAMAALPAYAAGEERRS